MAASDDGSAVLLTRLETTQLAEACHKALREELQMLRERLQEASQALIRTKKVHTALTTVEDLHAHVYRRSIEQTTLEELKKMLDTTAHKLRKQLVQGEEVVPEPPVAPQARGSQQPETDQATPSSFAVAPAELALRPPTAVRSVKDFAEMCAERVRKICALADDEIDVSKVEEAAVDVVVVLHAISSGRQATVAVGWKPTMLGLVKKTIGELLETVWRSPNVSMVQVRVVAYVDDARKYAHDPDAEPLYESDKLDRLKECIMLCL